MWKGRNWANGVEPPLDWDLSSVLFRSGAAGGAVWPQVAGAASPITGLSVLL